jgi:bacterioferritin-associated ferredoxin
VNLDDRICYCYHVPLRKLVNFARRERPACASQMSQCLGAGTGCGWCIPILKKIFAEAAADGDYGEGRSVEGLPETADEYAAARRTYLRSGTPKNTF